MSQQRLVNLAVILIEKELSREVSIIDEFAAEDNMRIMLA